MPPIKTATCAALAALALTVGAANTASAFNERNHDRWSRTYKPGQDRHGPSIRVPSTERCFRVRTRNGSRTICR
jgi:hypothetical protein